jgi:hypothetical protein
MLRIPVLLVYCMPRLTHVELVCMLLVTSELQNFFHHIYLFIYCNWVATRGSGYSTCKQNMKLVTTRFKSEGLHEKHVVATWNLGNHLSICL